MLAASILVAVLLICATFLFWASRKPLGAPPPGETWRVSAKLQTRHVRVGGFIHVILRAVNTSGKLGAGYAGWPPWWMVWQVRSPGAVLEPVASSNSGLSPQHLKPGETCVWDACFFVQKGSGNRTLNFGLKSWADRYVVSNAQPKSGSVTPASWCPHTPKAGVLWTKPLHLVFQKVAGSSPAPTTGPLQVQVRLKSYHPKAGRWVEATLIVKNVSRHPTVFRAMSCSWWDQWTANSTDVAWHLWNCNSNFLVAHLLIPGQTWSWKDKLTFRPWPRVCTFRVGFTPLATPAFLPSHRIERTYWSTPVQVTVRR